MQRQQLTEKIHQLSAWLFFLAIPVANVPALMYGSLFLLLIFGAVSAEKTWPPRSLFWLFIPYVLIASASITWSFEAGNTLTALKREVYIPTLIFFTFYSLKFPRQLGITASALLVGLVFVCAVFASAGYPLPRSVQTVIQHYNPGVGDFSTFCILAVPVFYLVVTHAPVGRFARVAIAIVFLSLIFYGAFLTQNRMFWPAVAVTLFALLALHFLTASRKPEFRHLLAVAMSALVLVTLSLVFAYVKTAPSPGESLDGQVTTVVDHDPRWEIWPYYLRLIEKRPWLGYGYDRYIAYRHSTIPVPPADKAALSQGHGHNIFINQAAEIGIIGLASFILLWILLWRQYWRFIKSGPVRHYAVAGLILMIGYLTKNLTDDFYTRRNLLMFWALNGIWLRVIHDRARARVLGGDGVAKVKPGRLLIIRRDNIGDLVCTTPMIRLLRERFPDARIDVLVNSYNYPVLQSNPAVDQVFQYTKGKHRAPGQLLFTIYWAKLKLFLALRSHRYDLAILPGSVFNKRGVQFARFVGAREVLGFFEHDRQRASGLTLPVNIQPLGRMHEVEFCCELLRPLGVQSGQLPRQELFVTEEERRRLRSRLGLTDEEISGGLTGLHMGARKPSNRWPEASYVALIRELWREEGKPILLFWPPGPADHPYHPGDDEGAARILRGCGDIPVIGCATTQLRDLIAGIGFCDTLICSDGGAMHIGAGLGKPIVCLFGDSDAWHWYPWGVPYRLLQTPDRRARSVTVEAVLDAYRDLRRSLSRSEVCNS